MCSVFEDILSQLLVNRRFIAFLHKTDLNFNGNFVASVNVGQGLDLFINFIDLNIACANDRVVFIKFLSVGFNKIPLLSEIESCKEELSDFKGNFGKCAVNSM